jgi:hypothetical protein
MPHFYPFVYYQRVPTDREIKKAAHVDVTAMMHVTDALYRQGYTLGEVQLNHPPARDTRPSEEFGLDAFEPGALVVSVTRADLEAVGDEPFDCKKTVQKGFTPLEAHIEAAWRLYLYRCVRLQVTLHAWLTPYFSQGYQGRRNIAFSAREGARYAGLPGEPSFRSGKSSPTAAYLLRLPELFPGGPGYLGVFGMDSLTALVWSQLLRHRHADLLQGEGLVIAELSGPVPGRVHDLRWALGWESRIILRAPVAPHGAASPARTVSLDRKSSPTLRA